MRIYLSIFLALAFASQTTIAGTSTFEVHNASATKYMNFGSVGSSWVILACDSSGAIIGGSGFTIQSVSPSGYVAPGAFVTVTVNADGADYGYPKFCGRCFTASYSSSSSGSSPSYYNANVSGWESTHVPNGSTSILYLSESGFTTVVYTNYTMTLRNTSSINFQRAVWTYNGSVVKTALLSPLTSDSWTTPSLRVSPAPADTFNLNGTLNDVLPTIGLGDGSGVIFTNPILGGTLSGSAGSASGSGSGSVTNGGFSLGGGTGGVVPNTNAIIWSAPSGSASESTLQAGFSTVHSDLQNILAAQAIQNGSFIVMTNSLGQVVTYLTAMSNETLQVIGAITNMSAKINTNGSTLTLTNYATETTLSNINSNIAALLNSQTNVNTNSERAGESRMLGLVPDTATNSASATAAATTLFATASGYLGDAISSLSTPPDIGTDPGHTAIWNVQIGSHIVDLDPVDNYPTVAAWSIGIWDYVLIGAYLMFVGRLYIKTIQILSSSNTGGVPDMEVVGGAEALTFGGWFGGNFVGVLVAVIIPAVLLALWVVVVTAVIVPLGEFVGIYNAISALFSSISSTDSGKAGLHLLFSYIPVALAVRLFTAGIVLQFTMAKVLLICCAASRYLFGK